MPGSAMIFSISSDSIGSILESTSWPVSVTRIMSSSVIRKWFSSHAARDLGLTLGRTAIALPGHVEDFGCVRVAL